MRILFLDGLSTRWRLLLGGHNFYFTLKVIFIFFLPFCVLFPTNSAPSFPQVVYNLSQYVQIPHGSYQLTHLGVRSPGLFGPGFYIWSTVLTLTSSFTIILGHYLFLELEPLFPGSYYFFFLGLPTPSLTEKGYVNEKFFENSHIRKYPCLHIITSV